MKRADAMAQLPRDLPDGRAGQALALAISAALLALVGFGVIRPGLAWYRGLSTRVATVSTLLAHERRLVAELPALRRMAARAAPAPGATPISPAAPPPSPARGCRARCSPSPPRTGSGWTAPSCSRRSASAASNEFVCGSR
ncbi:hypothetical protein APM_2692 [Acidiphilium sp. PM]|nr:hypothetical protein APM_2692 [Acidiphilium sp. PM]